LCGSFSVVANAARAGDRAVEVLYQTAPHAESAQRAAFRKIAKTGQIIFSRSSRERCRETTRFPDDARKQAE
jgi:hypothetical protein